MTSSHIDVESRLLRELNRALKAEEAARQGWVKWTVTTYCKRRTNAFEKYTKAQVERMKVEKRLERHYACGISKKKGEKL